MMRKTCCLALTCLIVACAPRKAVLVEETPLTKPKQTGPRPRPMPDESSGGPELVVQESGMRLPDLTQKLPDRKDMAPTAAPATGGGPTAIATPPKE